MDGIENIQVTIPQAVVKACQYVSVPEGTILSERYDTASGSKGLSIMEESIRRANALKLRYRKR